MSNINNSDNLLDVLKEREKELNCLYMVDDILENHQLSLPELLEKSLKYTSLRLEIPRIL